MLKSEIRKGEAQRIQAARHAFCRRQKKIRGKKAKAQRTQAARHAFCKKKK
jgi:hypothetical protein